MTATFHVIFNVALAAIFIGLLGPLAKLLEKAFPARATISDPDAPRHLDPSALDTPSLALADAARETLHIAAAGDDRVKDERPLAGYPGVADGQRGRPSRRGD
jgi:Na+/phosphate symporter